MKICNRCLKEKNFSEFSPRTGSKDGYRNDCKQCRRDNHSLNKEGNNKKSSEYYINNREKLLSKANERKFKNRNLDGKIIKIKILSASLEENEKVCTKCLLVKNKNRFLKDSSKKDTLSSHCIDCKNYYFSNRKKIDKIFKLSCSIRSIISSALSSLKVKKVRKSEDILGCSFRDFRKYIELKFVENMSWDNYGKWHLDHIKPISLAKTENEVYELNHYTNFQPLWASENMSKNNKYPYFMGQLVAV